ncbi:MAG: phage/plasmid primase, P4 family [Candidatus Paceibacterota bacterium]
MEILKQIELQERGDAEVLSEIFENKLVFDHEERQWYIFENNFWRTDHTSHVYNLVEAVAKCYEAAIKQAEIDPANSKYRLYKARINSLRNRAGIKNALELATAKLALKQKWDSNPFLLAVKNGVIELKTGELREGKPSDYIRKVADVEWKGLEEPCPRFELFMQEMFPRNQEIIDFLQRMFGYSISGLSVEHIMPVFFGAQGRNGKDVLLSTICSVLGDDLASPISKEVLLSGLKSPGASAPFLYELQGKRLVYSDETSEGAGFDESQVKMLSGGAPFVAKKLYMQPTIIHPEYLLVLITNNRPVVSAEDDAIWERLVLVQFTERFVDNPIYDNEHPQDKYLKYKLEEEKSGILAWLVRGFLQWQEKGLDIPDSVKYTTDNYRTEQDAVGRFIDTECIIDNDEKVSASNIFRCYEQWTQTDSVKKLNSREFARKLEAKGFQKRRYAEGYFYLGLNIKPTVEMELEKYLEEIQQLEEPA